MSKLHTILFSRDSKTKKVHHPHPHPHPHHRKKKRRSAPGPLGDFCIVSFKNSVSFYFFKKITFNFICQLPLN